MPNLKPYRTKAQKAEARRTARKDQDGAWRSEAPFCLHGQPGEWVWDASHKVPVRADADEEAEKRSSADASLRRELQRRQRRP